MLDRDSSEAPDQYERPAITPLGHLADLTLLGEGAWNEIDDDGSQA